MKPVQLTLAILLGASVLLNAVLLLRTPEPEPTPDLRPRRLSESPSRPRDPADAPADSKVERLEARIRQLEAENAEGVKAGPAPATTDRLAAFRDAVKKYHQFMKRFRESEGEMDRDAQLEYSNTYMEIMRAMSQRTKDPGFYVDAIRSFYEVSLAELGKPLTAEQRERMTPLLDAQAAALRELAAGPALERFVKEIEAEHATLSGLDAVLAPEQREGVSNATSVLSSANLGGMQWVERTQAESTLVRQWTRSYGIDAVQKPALQRAAAGYVAELERLMAGAQGHEGELWGDGPKAHEFRLAAARAQVEAIRLFQGALTAEQLEKVRTRTPTELRIYDQKAFAAPEAVEEDR